ncbi:MAG: PKD domain-containing protein, partial [Bacteroidia bacterium]|nr:PKD domain-containing protein [Bacteroidia bacterium]
DGAANTVVTGGVGPYSYSWNTTPIRTTPNVTGLPAGVYTVTVTDSKGCVRTDTARIFQPAVLVASATASPLGCAGTPGSISSTVTGGNPPYSYSWNTTPVQTTPTATNLSTGTYTLTVTDSRGCTDTAVATVLVNIPLTLSIQIQDSIVCHGDTATIAAIAGGGTPPYSYSW